MDLPGIIQGASEGKGRGRQVIAVARTADLVLMMLDATKGPNQRIILESELEAVGIRLNQRKPNVYFKVKTGGGVSFNATCKLTFLTERLVQQILHEYKIFNAEVLIREDVTVDAFIDVIVGKRKYVPCLYCYNKIDQISMEKLDNLARQPNTVVVSCELDLNLDYLVKRMWDALRLMRIYTKKRGQVPNFGDALIVRRGAAIEHVCHAIHRSIASQFRYALVWVSYPKVCDSYQQQSCIL